MQNIKSKLRVYFPDLEILENPKKHLDLIKDAVIENDQALEIIPSIASEDIKAHCKLVHSSINNNLLRIRERILSIAN